MLLRRITFVLILFLVLVSYQFAQGSSLAPITFCGDTQTGYTNYKKIVAGMVAQKPILVFHMGDLVSYKNDLVDWLNFDVLTKPIIDIAQFLPAIGNHDAYSGYFSQRFNLPYGGRYYAKTYGKVRFIVLDSNANFSYDEYQLDFLIKNLVWARQHHKTIMVIMHHPPIASDGGDYNAKKLLPIFAKYHVRVVFGGHYHNYERSYYSHVVYIITGGCGATLYDREKVGAYTRVYAKTYHFVKMNFELEKINFEVYDRDLKIIDNFKVSY